MGDTGKAAKIVGCRDSRRLIRGNLISLIEIIQGVVSGMRARSQSLIAKPGLETWHPLKALGAAGTGRVSAAQLVPPDELTQIFLLDIVRNSQIEMATFQESGPDSLSVPARDLGLDWARISRMPLAEANAAYLQFLEWTAGECSGMKSLLEREEAREKEQLAEAGRSGEMMGVAIIMLFFIFLLPWWISLPVGLVLLARLGR